MHSINIPGENGSRIKPKYSHFSNESPIALIFTNNSSPETENAIFKAFNSSKFNFLTIEADSSDISDDLINATCCWDWLRTMNPDTSECWVAGINKGAWVGMQLLMRRPEFKKFISINPPINSFDFSFLAPCPCSGMIIESHISEKDYEFCTQDIEKLILKTASQKSVSIQYQKLEKNFKLNLDEIENFIKTYIKEGVKS